jgi:asparagine synthase (glutamine-hydrolysing)
MNHIAGIINIDHTFVDAVDIVRMIHAGGIQMHEQAYLHVDENVGFSCVSIGDNRCNRVPAMHYCRPNSQLMITFDGRIDNRHQLLPTLKSQITVDPELISDEEIIIAAYERWGLDSLKHLIGDFAFAIWDKGEQRLLCARDPLGVKPFYYSMSREAFVFGSSPMSILAARKNSPRIHKERIADFIMELAGTGLEGVDKTSSFYQDIFRLPPAHLLVLVPGGITLHPYWDLQPAMHPNPIPEDDYIQEFVELFQDSVRCRLCDSPAGATLSGGLDSSSIVAMGRNILMREGNPPLNVFAVISASPGENRETPHIDSVLRQGSIQAHLISENNLKLNIDSIIRSMEREAEPFDCLMNLMRLIDLHAREKKICALLDGIDGDALLSGSGSLLKLWRHAAIRTIIDETVNAGGLTAEYKLGFYYLVQSFLSVITPHAPQWFRNIRKPFRYRKTVPEAVQNSIIDPEFAQCSSLVERVVALDSYSPRPPSLEQMEFHKIVLNHSYLTAGLERYERVARDMELEARHPLVDIRLMEFSLGLPWQLKNQRGWTKMILRRAMEPYLPPDVVWRSNRDNLMWVINRLILKSRSEYLHQATMDERENLKPYVDVRKLEKYWHEYLVQGDEKNAVLIWSGVALAFWLRRHKNMIRDLKLQQ